MFGKNIYGLKLFTIHYSIYYMRCHLKMAANFCLLTVIYCEQSFKAWADNLTMFFNLPGVVSG